MKKKKLLIDILLLCTLLISFVSGKILVGSDAIAWWIVHIGFSLAFVVLVVIHLCVNGRGWFEAGKMLFRGEKYAPVRGRYIVDWLLLIVWGVVFLSGFPAIGHKLGVANLRMLTKAFHSGFSTLGFLLIIVHGFQHAKQIKFYFSKQKNGVSNN